MAAEGTENGAFPPRENPKWTRPIRQDEAPVEPRLALSTVIDQTINVMDEREEQRHNLINTLIIVQLLVTAAVSFGYHDKPGLIFPVMLGSLVVYLAALVFGNLLKDDRLAAYILVFGGGVAITAQVVAAMLTGSAEATGHVALFFLAVMLEAGLLMIPQITVIVVATSLAISGAMLLLIAINSNVSGSQIYVVMLYTLSPLALTAIISWLLSHFIYATAVTAQHAQDLEFRQAQFQQMKTHERERHEQLDTSIGAIQVAIAQAITGDYTVRVPVIPGDLEVVENSLNLLLDTFDSMVQVQQENARMTGAVLPITEGLNRLNVNDSVTPVHTIKTDTPFDNVSVMVSRIADNYNRRFARLQEQLGRVSAGVAHSRDGLTNASDEFVAARRQAGALISRAEGLQASLQKQLELLAQARRMMATVLPSQITQMADLLEGGNPALKGLGIGIEPGLTHEFETLAPPTPGEANIAPLTMPLPALDAHRSADESRASGSHRANGADGAHGQAFAAGDELPVELVEVWHLLLQIGEELNQQERAVASVAQELSVLSRTVRNADAGIAWTLTALDTVQKSSDMAQQSSAQHPAPDGTDEGSSDGQDSGGFSLRPAGPSRPLWPGSGAPENADRPAPRGSLSGSDLLGSAAADALKGDDPTGGGGES
ncbi:MAG TPA: hypothetical protein VJO13_08340 [Ktedonobacterales bacterium]|nr:hypothetical protein [Ktedonobacterales bacterium]